MVKRLAIFGPGGFGRELIKAARDQIEAHLAQQMVELVFASDCPGPPFNEVRQIDASELRDTDLVIIAIGDPSARAAISRRIRGIPFTLKASTAIVGPQVEIGDGSVFCDYTIVTASAKIGKQFQCNIYSYVAHDCIVGDFVTFAPRVSCNGNVHIGNRAYVGTGAVLRNGKSDKPLIIGEDAVIGMGAVVTKDVPAGATVIGNPAKIMQ